MWDGDLILYYDAIIKVINIHSACIILTPLS